MDVAGLWQNTVYVCTLISPREKEAGSTYAIIISYVHRTMHMEARFPNEKNIKNKITDLRFANLQIYKIPSHNSAYAGSISLKTRLGR